MKLDFKQFFGYEPTVKAHAPGRIEFIGNHTDYNGGLVMGVAVDKGVTVEAALRDDDKIRLTTTHGDVAIETRIDNLEKQTGSRVWANYIIGVICMMREAGMKMEKGFDLHVHSDLPSGAGLSSSAALELSVAWAAAKMYGFSTDKATLARIGRRAENEFVGMPCGILDQGVSAFGEKDAIVRIDCATEEFSTIAMPHGLRFWVLNTNEKHNLVESFYATRHKECMEAYRILSDAGTKAKNLAGVSPDEIERATLPEVLRKRALHVSTEHRRVMAMGEALKAGDKVQMGKLLYASHESSRSLFENTTEKLDTLVGIMKKTKGVVGARMTGGGFGGAAMALADEDFTEAQAEEVCAAFEKAYPGCKLTVFSAAAGEGAGLCQA